MQNIPGNLSQLRLLAKSLSTATSQTSGIGRSGFDSLIRAALSQPGKGLIGQVAELMLLNSSSRLGEVESPSQATPQFSASRPWRAGGRALPLLQNLKPLGQTNSLSLPAGWKSNPTAAPANIPSQTSAQRQEIDALIDQAAQRYKLDPNLVRAVVTAESDFDPQTVSQAGAMGLMQLMPETAADMGVKDAFDPVQNIEGGTRYLSLMLERFGGDESKALAAYNWGPSNVERGGRLPSETRTYLKRVARFKAMYAGGFSAKA
jgi:soluble lytic murein transglycosylase-like protein